MKRTIRTGALLGVAALALAACGDAPEDSGGGGGGETTAASSDFTGCMVTDAGGVDDRSFNASAYEGLKNLESSEGIDVQLAESTSDADYEPNVSQMVSQDCGIVVTVGFLLEPATSAAATANPEESFALVDSAPAEPIDNLKPLLFNTAEASFLAGYAAAGVTESGTVATFGGLPIPSVTIFMDGFVDGVARYNEDNGTDVKVLGWDKEAQDGSFTGNFDDQSAGRQLTENFISQGADIVMPVAGPVGLGAAAAAEADGNVKIIWVDSDGYESAAQYGPLFLTSVIKRIDTAVEDAATEAMSGDFTSEPFVGTLENEGVGIAPFHDFEDEVPQELKDQLDTLREGIVSGDIVVESPSTPGG